jgi:hypothetical protein
MRTKALLSVAAIAASAISAMAQSNVYSLNIVGYATVAVPPGYSILANPLSAGTRNGADEIMPIIDGELILTWSGSKFTQVGYDAGNGGWVQADDATPATPPALPPGTGFFFFNPLTTATNFTFVGQVVPGPSSTNTTTLVPGYNLIGSALPASLTTAAGGVTNTPISLPAIDGMLILTWNSATSKYVQTGYDLGNGGWVQADDATPSVVPPYTIGEGFFYFNPLTTAAAWPQSLP